MNRTELVAAVAAKAGSDSAQARRYVDAVFETIMQSVTTGEKVVVTGFGTFDRLARPARTIRNPRTGQSMAVGPSQVPRFVIGRTFRDRVSAVPATEATAATEAIAATDATAVAEASGASRVAEASVLESTPEPGPKAKLKTTPRPKAELKATPKPKPNAVPEPELKARPKAKAAPKPETALLTEAPSEKGAKKKGKKTLAAKVAKAAKSKPKGKDDKPEKRNGGKTRKATGKGRRSK